MLLLKYLLLSAGIAMFVIAAGILSYDAYLLLAWQRRRLHPDPESGSLGPAPAMRWRTTVALVMLAWAPLLISAGIVIVPSGMAGVRVSQTKGTLAGTLYPGVHFVVPLIERVEMFNTRDQLFTTGINEDSLAKGVAKGDALHVQAKEGLTLGLAITVRYQVDPKRLDYIEANLPQPLEKEIVPPVVATAWRELVPGYTVREVFSSKREEVRQRSAEIIRKRLAADGIVVKEVMLRDIELPQEYAKGLESLLLKEQENDRMGVETEIHQKQVKVAEADAERMRNESVILKQNPLLINKIVAERLSDKLQIMMVPADGKFFFTNDVLRGMNTANHVSQSEDAAETPEPNDK